MKNKFLAVNYHGVPRVIAALKTDDNIFVAADKIYYLPLPFISPLQTYKNGVH
jgi:hypothetical protein